MTTPQKLVLGLAVLAALGAMAPKAPAPVAAPVPVAEARSPAPAPTAERMIPEPKRWTQAELLQNTYDVAREVCAYDPEGVYKEARTRDKLEAAEWYGLVSKEGPHRDASTRGCLDALMGRTSEGRR